MAPGGSDLVTGTVLAVYGRSSLSVGGAGFLDLDRCRAAVDDVPDAAGGETLQSVANVRQGFTAEALWPIL